MANFSIFASRTFWTVAVVMAYDDVQIAIPFLHGGVAVFAALVVNFLGLVLATYFHINPSQRYNPPATQ